MCAWLALLAPHVVAGASGCSDDRGCSLNGLCSPANGLCECDPGWTGTHCEQLDLLPMPQVPAYGWTPNVTSWGGSPVKGNDGKWHLFVSEITEGCGLFYWDKNSQCTHAVADSIEGPYAKQDVALPVWAHSCRAFRDHKTGTWLLFHVGEGNPGNGGGEVNCTHNASHPPLAGPSTSSAVDPKHMATTSGYLHNASSPEGPWEPVVPLGWSFPHSTNPGERLLPAQCGDPAPFQHDDGSWSMVCDTFPDDFFVATAPHYSGPWTIGSSLGGCDESNPTGIHPNPKPWSTWFHCNASWPNPKTPANPHGSQMEDPFHWIDNRGNWHVISHQYIYPSFEDPVSGHAYSKDGKTWAWSSAQPFHGNVCEKPHEPGSQFTFACGSRERPFLVFDEERRPTHLVSAINSVCQGGNKDSTGKDWTYTSIQPIRLPPLKTDDLELLDSRLNSESIELRAANNTLRGGALIAELDCAIRKLAYQYGAEILAATGKDSPVGLQRLQASLLWPSAVKKYCDEGDFTLRQTARVAATLAVSSSRKEMLAKVIYVCDKTGSDTAAGTLVAPFKTLQRAQQQVRNIISKDGSARQPITVNIRAGVYHINRTLTFGPQDGGTAEAPVVWTAYQHEEVVISGGQPIAGLKWVPARPSFGLGPGVMKAQLPASLNATTWTSLFVGSKRAIWSRWPNGDPAGESGLCLRRAAGQVDPHTGKLLSNSHASAPQWDPAFPTWAPNCTDPLRSQPNKAGRLGWATAGGGSFGEWEWPTKPVPVKGTPRGSIGRSGPTYSSFASCTGGAAARYTPPFNSWCCGGGSNVRTGLDAGARQILSSGEIYQPLGTPGMNWTRTERARVQIFHPLLWGWWAFSVKHASTGCSICGGVATGLVNFSAGGWQEARGGNIGQHFYIENILEELDFEREWYVLPESNELFYMPSAEESIIDGRIGATRTTGTKEWVEQEITAPILETVVRVQGSITQPVKHIEFAGLTITHSTTTYMEPYEVPSGGDWAVHRGAAFVVEGAEEISILNCSFDQPGGNGLLLSDYTRNCSVRGNEFAFSGDSAIVSIGRAQRLIDPENHTDGLFPAGNVISKNYIHDVGVYGKQTSCYFQSKSCGNTIEFNICANGPRDSINYDDGFAGYNTLRGNLIFNAMRETNDGGPFNQWDRTTYITPSHCQWGNATTEKHGDVMEHNLILLGPFTAGNYGLDFDDGTRNVTARSNILYGGGHKNYEGQNKNASDNLFLYPELSDQLATFDRFQGCMASDGTPTNGEVFENNVCVVHDGSYFFNFNNSLPPAKPSQAHCTPETLNKTVAFLRANTYYSPVGDFMVNCNGKHMHLRDFQAQGFEVGSTVGPTPPVSELVKMARTRLLPVPQADNANARATRLKTDADGAEVRAELSTVGGKLYEGIGAISSSTATALFDYPPAEQERILDLLFTPRTGAAVQILKLEIPGDGDSTVLSEPSHMHSTDDLSYERGVEYRLMAAARRRNPDIKLYALQWTAPSWVAAGGRSLLTTQNINYTLSWLHGARARWNISTMDYLGFWNEQAEPSSSYILELRAALNTNGWQHTKLVHLDSSWDESVFDQVMTNSEVRSVIHALGLHAPPDCPVGPAGCAEKPLIPSWSNVSADKRPLLVASEDGNLPCNLAGALLWGERMSHNWLALNITFTIRWSLIWTAYPGAICNGAGLLRADTPWASFQGDSSTNPAPNLHTTAHWTWFTAPSWMLLLDGHGSGRLPTCGTYVSLFGPSGELTTIVETLKCYSDPQTLTLALPPAIKISSLAQWITNSTHLLAPLSDVGSSGSSFKLTVAARSIYTFTSVRFSVPFDSIADQRMPTQPGATAAPARPFPLPYIESFSECGVDQSPKFLTSFEGSFTCWYDYDQQDDGADVSQPLGLPCNPNARPVEMCPPKPGQPPKHCPQCGNATCHCDIIFTEEAVVSSQPPNPQTPVLRQWVVERPVRWHYYDSSPLALVAPGYANYMVSVRAKLPTPSVHDQNEPRYLVVCGRQDKFFSGWTPSLGGYCFRVNASSSSWDVIARNRTLIGESQAPPIVLVRGKLPTTTLSNTWHELTLHMKDETITAMLDKHTLASVNDSMYSSGLAGFGSGFHFALFRSINVTATVGMADDNTVRSSHKTMLSLNQLNDGFQQSATCGWYGLAFKWTGPPTRITSLARFRTPSGVQSHNVSVFASNGSAIASAVVLPHSSGDAAGFVWESVSDIHRQPQLETGCTYMLASQEGGNESDFFYANANSGGCRSNSDGHDGGTPWVLSMLGANVTVLFGSVSADCEPDMGPLVQHAWQHLNDGSEHTYGPVNLRIA